MRFTISILILSIFVFSCKPNLKEKYISAGSADFTRFVAIGNSLTAGYADGALCKSGQQNAYPLMLANQFKLAGGGDFKVPYMNDGGGNDGSDNPRRVLGFAIPCGSTSPTLAPVWDAAGVTALNNVSAAGPYNLVGVPGALAIYGTSGAYSGLNPFLQRFCASPNTSSMLSEAMRINPTFFTLWLGSNDVLLYAVAGAVPPVDLYSPRLSSDTLLRMVLTAMVDSLTTHGAKGAIANVPDVTSAPYFTTIPWNGVVLTQGKADTLNAIYSGTGITWTAGANGFMIVDSTVPGVKMRHATAYDYILLSTPSDSLRCGQWGVNPLKPLKDKYVLDVTEVTEVRNATIAYNASIAYIAATKNIALVDINSFLKTVQSGIVYNGIAFNTSYVSGGAFSLDGVHPNPRGYALIANEYIKAINAKYGSSVPEVDVTRYTGIVFP